MCKPFLLGLCGLLLTACVGRSTPPSPPSVSETTKSEASVSVSSVSEPSLPDDVFSSREPETDSLAIPIPTGIPAAEQTAWSANTPEWQFTPAENPEAAYREVDIPLLVNAQTPLATDYDPQAFWVKQLPYPFSAKGMSALIDMVQAAQQDGIELVLMSGYRSVESQTRNFANKVQEYKNLGYSDAEAERETARYIAYPGTSEHNLGLAADLNSLDESFEDTAQFAWLQENAQQFGFVLRYPKDKEAVTGIAYEPWHYRYVGSNHAKIMNDEGLCLEEYVHAYG